MNLIVFNELRGIDTGCIGLVCDVSYRGPGETL